MKLTVKNFQSISDAEFEFPIGITALVGASNSGKTSIVRAIDSVLTNTSEAKTFIKHGESETEVELSVDSYPQIKWARTIKDSSYIINNELHQKVGKTDLFNLSPNNGFCQDSDGNILNIQDEWSVLFPFDRTSGDMYKLFENVFAINDSTAILKEIKNDESSRKKSLVDLTNEYQKGRRKIDTLEDYLNTSDIKSLEHTKELLITSTKELEDLTKDCTSTVEDLKFLSRVSKIKTVEVPESEIDYYSKLITDINYLEDNKVILDREVSKVDADLDIIVEFIKLEDDVIYLENNIALLDTEVKSLDFNVEGLEDYVRMEADCSKLISDMREYRQLTEEYSVLKEELSKLEDEYKSIDVCPLCGNKMN